MHIRALGDHTTEIVELSKKKKPTWIRIDGPYGRQDYNPRRYPVLLLVGGGVGITPVMSMVKDLFYTGDIKRPFKMEEHAIQSVYAIQVCRFAKELDTFTGDFQACMDNSSVNELLPNLVVWQYVSRAKPEELANNKFGITGRPKFANIFGKILKSHPNQPVLVFACGPGAMVNELWDLSTQHTRQGHRIDFKHEIFEF